MSEGVLNQEYDMKKIFFLAAAMLAYALGPATAAEMPKELFGKWCEVFKRSTYDGRVLPERSNGWYVNHHLDKSYEPYDEECVKKDGYLYTISKNQFAGCTLLHVGKMKLTGPRGFEDRMQEWTVKARCPGDEPEVFYVTKKFTLWKGFTLTTYTK
jgi:hypothetical protein